MLYDLFGRKIDYLRISVTDRCNLRCVYCMPEYGVAYKPHEELLTFEEIGAIVKACVCLGINKIRITGGEPLVRKGIVGLVEILSSIKGLEDISMTTNGVLLKEFAVPLKKAGLKRLNISFDSPDPVRFKNVTRIGNLEEVVEGLEEAARAGFAPIKLNVVLLENMPEEEIVEFLRMTLESNINIRFLEFMPVNSFFESGKSVSCETVLRLAGIIGSFEETAIYGHGPAKSFKFHNSSGSFGLISPMSDKFCAECNRIRLTSDGYLKGCLHSKRKTNLRDALRSGAGENDIIRLICACAKEKQEEHVMDYKAPAKMEEHSMCQIGG
ncbi:MAG: cyclic pyranopterin phosphate synthase MoaA [Candidatus Firestonebacteria bacterium RIFOXYC2_FULL_39_67]|nr:MAG: cyclic pyranopterin phosphate synthase MoaA [Candidatus Firestonebacteria bacterium RIFOXYC2_FULL_39_67]